MIRPFNNDNSTLPSVGSTPLVAHPAELRALCGGRYSNSSSGANSIAYRPNIDSSQTSPPITIQTQFANV